MLNKDGCTASPLRVPLMLFPNHSHTHTHACEYTHTLALNDFLESGLCLIESEELKPDLRALLLIHMSAVPNAFPSALQGLRGKKYKTFTGMQRPPAGIHNNSNPHRLTLAKQETSEKRLLIAP